MKTSREIEIDKNYDFLQRNLRRLLKDHGGEYALLRHERVEGFFKRPGDAYRAGLAQFYDGIFSIQEIRSEPIELGHLSFDPG